MKFINNLKVRTLFLTSFLTVAIFIVIVGIVGSVNISRINSASNELVTDNVASMNQLNTFNQNVLLARLETMDLVESRDKSNASNIKSKVNTYQNANNTILKKYRNKILNTTQRDLTDELQNNLSEYRKSLNSIFDLMSQGKYDNAMSVNKQSAELRRKLSSTIDKMIKYESQSSTSKNIKNNSIYKSSIIVTILLSIIGVIAAISLGIILSSSTSKVLNRISRFASSIKNGDFTHSLKAEGKNEFGQIAEDLNQAINSTKKLISELSNTIKTITESSQNLSATTEEISSMMLSVDESTRQISEGSQNLSSITEEISASSQEMEATTNELSIKANNSSDASIEIKEHASDIKEKVSKNIEESNTLYEEKRGKILKAIEDGKVVSEVKTMAASIGNISQQTNLLALNAAIEAARAGEHGKGFAVVADEVRELAEESSTAVDNISKMVAAVENAFKNMSESSKEVLEYIANNVNPNYQFIMKTGMQYENDADSIKEIAEQVDSSAKQMHEAASQVSTAIQNAASTAEESASSSEEITESINEVTKAIEDISSSSQAQYEMAEKLSAMIEKFKIV